MRGRNTSMEEGNTYEQYVRVSRLAEAVVEYALRGTERCVSFQDPRGLGFDDIVEVEGDELRGFQVKDKVSGITRSDIEVLLRSLVDAPWLVGCLVLSGMIGAKGAPRIDVLMGLCQASRKAKGKLPHFAHGRLEEECLAECASLSGVSETAVFELFGRMSVDVPGPKAAVQAHAVRTLAQLFEDPDQAFDRLLREVVDVAACGARFHAERLLDDLKEIRRVSPVWKPRDNGNDDALLWERDSRGVARTYWVALEGAKAAIRGSAAGLLLGGYDKLWRFRRCQRRVPLALPSLDDPDVPGPVRFETLATAELVDIGSGDVIELGLLDLLGDTSGLDSLDHRVELRGSFSSTAVVWAGAHHGGYMAATSDNSARGSVLDLDHGTVRELWTAEDAKLAVERFGRPAMIEQNEVDGFESSLVELRQLLVRYGEALQPQAELQFARDVCGAETDGSWNRYEASIDVREDWFPPQLAGAVVLPECLVRRFAEYPMRADSEWGWTICPVEERARALLPGTFAP